MDENKSSLKSIMLFERLKQDGGLIGCAVSHALEVECSSMDNCSACSVETCNRMVKLIWQDMNDYVSTYEIDGNNIFDLRREYVALVAENARLREQLNFTTAQRNISKYALDKFSNTSQGELYKEGYRAGWNALADGIFDFIADARSNDDRISL